MGLLMRGQKVVSMTAKHLEKALSDDSPYVRVVAAEALGKHGNKDQISKAVETLSQIADPIKNGCFPSMLAMNAIDHLDHKAKSLLPLLETMPQIPEGVDKRFQGYVGRLVNTTVEELKAK